MKRCICSGPQQPRPWHARSFSTAASKRVEPAA
jgi:hypothetical protein